MKKTKEFKIGQRVKKDGHIGKITGKSGQWFHVDWDNWNPRVANYWGHWELKRP